jgi:hypothetical protein
MRKSVNIALNWKIGEHDDDDGGGGGGGVNEDEDSKCTTAS